MRVDLFDFELPPALIAARPAVPRDGARLLQVTQAGLFDRNVRDLPGVLRAGDLMVFNDTRVLPARLLGHRGAMPVELLLHKQQASMGGEPAGGGAVWLAFARPAKRLKPGQVVDFGEEFQAEVLGREGSFVRVRFDRGGAALMEKLAAVGHIPLPPYIPRADDAQDRTDYQTVYAARDGAVAAPTAGLHFTPDLLAALAAKGVGRATVTLHVGAGTFLPVSAEDTDQHVMHAEWGEISAETAATINAARARGGRILAVGTTSLRLLESAANADGSVRPFSNETAIFITPGVPVRAVDLLMTNFHLPKSTLFMLVCAFAGMERMHAAYAHAIASGYRFYSYGDASLLERQS